MTFCNISDFVPPSNATSIHLVSHHIQILLITIIILVCVLANLLIISNIINCDIKSRIISFQLIKYLCFVDLIGACTVLPIPLAATIQGDYGQDVNTLAKYNTQDTGAWVLTCAT